MHQRLENLFKTLQQIRSAEAALLERGVSFDGEVSTGSDGSDNAGPYNYKSKIQSFVVGCERIELTLDIDIGDPRSKRNEWDEDHDVDCALLVLTITEESATAAGVCGAEIVLSMRCGKSNLQISWDGVELLSLVRDCFTRNGLKFSDYSDPLTEMNEVELRSALASIANIVREAKLRVR